MDVQASDLTSKLGEYKAHMSQHPQGNDKMPLRASCPGRPRSLASDGVNGVYWQKKLAWVPQTPFPNTSEKGCKHMGSLWFFFSNKCSGHGTDERAQQVKGLLPSLSA